MKLKTFCKVGLIVCLLLAALGMTTYAASITSVSGTDGTNAFATSESAISAATPLETTLSVSGTTDIGDVNVAILIEAEGTIVYVNQTIADSEGNFSFSFPVSLEKGYVYVVKVNTENSDTATKLYFKTDSDEPVHYGDVDGNGTLTAADAASINRYLGEGKKVSGSVKANIANGIADVDGNGSIVSSDASAINKYLGEAKKISTGAKLRLSWSQSK